MSAPTIVIRTTDQISKEAGAKVLCYGETSAGKTALIQTAPRPLIISGEKGLLSLKKFKIPATEVKSLQDLGNVYLWLMQSADARHIDTIAVDSWSELAEVFLQELLPLAKDPRNAFYEVQRRVLEMTRLFRDIPNKNVYITAKAIFEKDEVSGAMKWMPMMPGTKLSQQLPFLFDEVWALRLSSAKDPITGLNYRYIQTQPDLQYTAKSRSGLAAQEAPDLTQLFSKMKA